MFTSYQLNVIRIIAYEFLLVMKILVVKNLKYLYKNKDSL